MKVNLLYDNKNLRSGYVNVDPFQFNTEGVMCADLMRLPFAPNEVESLLVNHILSHYTWSETEHMLNHYINLIHLGGEIVISDLNVYEVARQFTLGQIDINKYNAICYGDKHPRKSARGILDISNFLKAAGFTIQSRYLQDYDFVIKATR